MPGCPRLACVASLFASTALFLTILSSPVRAAVTLGAPPPMITCPPDKNLECSGGTPRISHTDASTPGCPAGIDRTWKATDPCGNMATCVQHIRFVDTTPPVITCPADKNLECGESTDPNQTGKATASDNCSTTIIDSFDTPVPPAGSVGQ